jgi:hypothetical protein
MNISKINITMFRLTIFRIMISRYACEVALLEISLHPNYAYALIGLGYSQIDGFAWSLFFTKWGLPLSAGARFLDFMVDWIGGVKDTSFQANLIR